MLINLLVLCMKFTQNTNRFHKEYLFERNLYWVYSDIHETQIAFLDWLTPHELLMIL